MAGRKNVFWTREQFLELIDKLGGLCSRSKNKTAQQLAEEARVCCKDNWFQRTPEHWPLDDLPPIE